MNSPNPIKKAFHSDLGHFVDSLFSHFQCFKHKLNISAWRRGLGLLFWINLDLKWLLEKWVRVGGGRLTAAAKSIFGFSHFWAEKAARIRRNELLLARIILNEGISSALGSYGRIMVTRIYAMYYFRRHATLECHISRRLAGKSEHFKKDSMGQQMGSKGDKFFRMGKWVPGHSAIIPEFLRPRLIREQNGQRWPRPYLSLCDAIAAPPLWGLSTTFFTLLLFLCLLFADRPHLLRRSPTRFIIATHIIYSGSEIRFQRKETRHEAFFSNEFNSSLLLPFWVINSQLCWGKITGKCISFYI